MSNISSDKCKRHKYQSDSILVRNGMIVGEIRTCQVCGHELRISDGRSSAPTDAAFPLLPNVVPLPAPSITTILDGKSSANITGSKSNCSTFLGKTVELENYGRGSIVDQTERSVGVKLDGEDCRIVYVSKTDLIPQ